MKNRAKAKTTISKSDLAAIDKIVRRAAKLFQRHGLTKINTKDLRLTICAAHLDIPLRLTELAEADDLNFTHDVCGIMKQLDRDTGRIKNYFVPRFAKHDTKA